MSKKYDLTGLGANVELAKGGVRVKANSGQVEFKNAADDAMVKVKALDGTASDDVVTKSQLDAVSSSNGMPYVSAALAFGTSSPLNVGSAVTSTLAFRWSVAVTTAFDGTTPLLDIGVSGTTDAIADQTEIDLTAVGVYSGTASLDISSSTQIIATYAADSSTAGAAQIVVEYI